MSSHQLPAQAAFQQDPLYPPPRLPSPRGAEPAIQADPPLTEIPAAETPWWEAITWFDRGALLLILVFAIIGLFRGVHWQLGRTAVLMLAYLAAIFLGPEVADLLAERDFGDPEQPYRLGQLSGTLAFVTALVFAGIVRWLVVRNREFAPPAPSSRLLGGGLGACTGALVVLAMLSALRLFHSMTEWGGSVVRAAEHSTVHDVGSSVLTTTGEWLPGSGRRGAEVWTDLFREQPRNDGEGTGLELPGFGPLDLIGDPFEDPFPEPQGSAEGQPENDASGGPDRRR